MSKEIGIVMFKEIIGILFSYRLASLQKQLYVKIIVNEMKIKSMCLGTSEILNVYNGIRIEQVHQYKYVV